MKNFATVMRRMRVYTSAVKKNYDSRVVELSKLSKYEGSKYYKEQVDEINKKIEDKRIKLAKEVRDDLIKNIQDMRMIVGNKIAKAPTTDMSNTLAMLNMLDTITPTQMKLYTVQMADCPLAMQVLQQIAKKNNMQIMVPDTEQMMRAVDVLESNLATFIEGYNGDTNTMSFTVKRMYDSYFQPEENYLDSDIRSAERADMAFWKDIIIFGSPDMLDEKPDNVNNVQVKHFFNDMDGMMRYIEQHTAGLEGIAKTEKENEILADCPGLYQARYRYYKSTGEKLPLNGEDLEDNQ